jgi:hypothetical protein
MPPRTSVGRRDDHSVDPGDDRLITPGQLCDEFLGGMSPRTFREWRARGLGPPEIRLAPQILRFRVGDVRRWIRDASHAAAARDHASTTVPPAGDTHHASDPQLPRASLGPRPTPGECK